MKKKGFIGICLATLAIAVVMIAGFFGACVVGTKNAVSVSAMAFGADSTALFNSNGSYAVSKSAIAKGQTFSFFGYNWRVVNVNGDTATFWMDSPYTTAQFATGITYSSTQSAANTWNSGYYNSTWQGQSLGTSNIRNLLISAANTIIGSKPGSNKVISGAVVGSNEANNTLTVDDIYYRATSTTNVKFTGIGETVNINYGIASTDRLWLPSYYEVKEHGMWGLTNKDRNWSGAVSQYAWLRSPFSGNKEHLPNNCYGRLVSYTAGTDFESVYNHYVDQVHGVRPAIHLNISAAASGESTDPWRIILIVVLIMGLIGIVLVTVAAVLRRRNAGAEA